MTSEKISIITDEISQDPEIVAKFLDENNVRTIEIRTMAGERVPNIENRVWEDFKMRARNEGWKVLALSPGTFKGDFEDEGKIGHELNEMLPDTIGRAVEINADFIITFGFMAPSGTEVPGYITSAMERAAELCDATGLKLLLENEPGSFADTGENTRKFIDTVGHPNLFANWDPCNSNIFNDPHGLALSARSLGNKIKHVHIKDGTPPPHDGLFADYSLISGGKIGWKEHLEVLKDMEYSGYFGIETHFEPLIENSAALIKEFRNLMKEVDYEGRFHGN